MRYYYVLVDGERLGYPLAGGGVYPTAYLVWDSAEALRLARSDFGARRVRGAVAVAVSDFEGKAA